MTKPIISAASHVTEHPDAYRKHIDPLLRGRAPHLPVDSSGGVVVVIHGLAQDALPMGLIVAAGTSTRTSPSRTTGRRSGCSRC